MPSKTIERTRSRRGGDESSPRSSKREQGWGAVARRQEELKNALKKLETLFVNFGLKLVKAPLSRFSKKNLIVLMHIK